MAKRRRRITDEEFDRMKEEWAKPRKSYAEMTWEEIEEHFRELGLPPPEPPEKVYF